VKDYPRSRPRRPRPPRPALLLPPVQLPALRFARQAFDTQSDPGVRRLLPKAGQVGDVARILGSLYPLDWAVCVGCLKDRTPRGTCSRRPHGRSDSLSWTRFGLRPQGSTRGTRTKQETAVTEFWSHLLGAGGEGRCRCSADMTATAARPLADPRLSEPAPEPPPEAPRPASPAGRRHRGAAAESHQGRRPLAPGVHPRRPGLAGRRAGRRTNSARAPLAVQNEPAGKWLRCWAFTKGQSPGRTTSFGIMPCQAIWGSSRRRRGGPATIWSSSC